MVINLTLPLPLMIFLVGLAAVFLLTGVVLNRKDECRDSARSAAPDDNGFDFSQFTTSPGSTKGGQANYAPCDPLPNGYQRQDYYEFGINDADIEYWGLDQPGAPEPFAAGLAIADILDDKEREKLFQ